jgi:exodeoxyribonuclease V alpha subunit
MDLQSLLDPEGRRTLRGTLERVVFHNEDNGYTVFRLRVQNKKDPVTVVGSMPAPQPGIGLTVTGTWVNDARFGLQFKMDSFESLLPATLEGIRHYLGSGLIKGVGQAMAGRIVEAFGEATFTVLDQDPDLLTTVKGLTLRKVSDIKAAWAEHRGIRDLIMFLQPHGVSTSYAVRIFRQYGPEAVTVLRENPYRLAMDIHGIGFQTADAVALKLGFAPDCALRAEAGLLYVLRNVTDEGNVFYPQESLVQRCSDDLGVETELVRGAIRSLALEERIVVEDVSSDEGEFFQAVYLGRFHH